MIDEHPASVSAIANAGAPFLAEVCVKGGQPGNDHPHVVLLLGGLFVFFYLYVVLRGDCRRPVSQQRLLALIMCTCAASGHILVSR